MTVSPTALRQLDSALRQSKQVLVEITSQTRWERPELALTTPPPSSGYALASTTLSQTRHEKRPYVSDVNHEHKWRRLDAVYPSMEAAARALGVREVHG